MSASIDTRATARRAEAAQPRRRKRAQQAPSGSPRRRRVVNALLLFAAIVLMVDALVGDKGLLERLRARKQLQEAETSLAALRHHNAQMRDQIQRLNDDADVIEAIAREELGLIRPGELLFIVRDAPSPAPR